MSNRTITEAKYNKVAGIVGKADRKKRKLPGSITRNSGERQSTGFSIASNVTRLRILTCAHTIADVFTAGHHHELTLDEVNAIFMFDIQCVHQEQEVRTMVSDQMISERTRWSTPAIAVALDTELDLLVLEADVGELVLHKVDGVQMACKADHPLIKLAKANPVKKQKLVLAGWPPQRSSASATGQVSTCDWTYDAVSGLNTKGYAMRLLEVHRMVGDSGFSGAPVLNGHCLCVGVFHGIFNLIMGYAVSLGDLNAFLEAHNVPPGGVRGRAPAVGVHDPILLFLDEHAAEASEDAISSLMAELESPVPSLDSLWRTAMELRLLAKHNPDNRDRIAKAGACGRSSSCCRRRNSRWPPRCLAWSRR
ncbi:hypothetical protein C2845_PM15G24370 [Panicum miliaceum]|uniref:Uncharacterized protein n=1 Tax=Panicum miliaceum TaxID=4540 RepID=A0A3L6QCW6_PANMI|nr:hypothetical protein C2845_PM15G24370 [Panicum miliaceum]